MKNVYECIKSYFTIARPEFPAAVKLFFQFVILGATVWATIIVAPSINYEFENQKRRSAFYISSIQSMNNDTKNMLGDLKVLYSFENSPEEIVALKRSISANITKLHWRSFELGLVFSGEKFLSLLSNYQQSLTELDKILLAEKIALDARRGAIQNFGIKTGELVAYIAEAADVRLPK